MDQSEYFNMRNLEERHWWYASTHEMIERHLDRLNPQSKVLDVGCGSGGFLNCIRERFQICGIDASLTALRAASSRKSVARRVAQSVAQAIPVGNGNFDAVTCIDVLYHQKVPSEQEVLREIHHVLKPGGYVILQVPAFEFLRGGHDCVVHTRKRYTKSDVRLLIEKNGFQIVMIRYRYPWLFLPALIIRWVTRNSAKSDLRPLPSWINRLLIGVNRLTDSALFGLLPFGTSVFAVAQKV
jgi:ubiquinone/menaquinone biosynthesis C-methylase UbiE